MDVFILTFMMMGIEVWTVSIVGVVVLGFRVRYFFIVSGGEGYLYLEVIMLIIMEEDVLEFCTRIVISILMISLVIGLDNIMLFLKMFLVILFILRREVY